MKICKRNNRPPWVVSLAFILSFCGKAPSGSESMRIIGSNDLVRLGVQDAEDELVKAIGLMQRGCTVSHIGQGLGLTAGHCFSPTAFIGQRREQACEEDAFKIRWGVVYGRYGYLTSRCTKILAYENNAEKDYALFKLEPSPTAALRLSLRRPHLGELVSLLSYPSRRPMVWSPFCPIAAYLPSPRHDFIAYACDTEEGSSGAPLFDEQLHLIGIHSFYEDSLHLNSGMLLAGFMQNFTN